MGHYMGPQGPASHSSPKTGPRGFPPLLNPKPAPTPCIKHRMLCHACSPSQRRAPQPQCHAPGAVHPGVPAPPPDTVHPTHSAVHRMLPRGWHPPEAAHPRAMPRVGTVHPGSHGAAPQPPCPPEQLGSAVGRGRCMSCNSNKIRVNKRFLVRANETQAVGGPAAPGEPPRAPQAPQLTEPASWGCPKSSAGL